LEERKSRRGKVNFDVYGSDDEEVGGGAYSSDSDKEDEKEEEEQEKVPQNEDFDMFGDAPADDPKGKKPAGREKKEDLRQVKGEELDSFDRSDDEDDIENGVRKEGKISAFNMKQEMEEGSIDANGNFIRNKVDPQAFHDKWMEGITRKDINKAKEAHDKRERDEAVKEAQRQAELPQTKTDIYRALVEYLQPRQNVQEALTSLSNSLPKKLPAWKQKMLDKKNKRTKQQPTKQQALSEEEEAERRRKVDMITALADQMMALGDFDIYEESFEVMVQHLRSEGVVPQDWLPASVNK
jgi:CD2 antigen cytoplasmic tail-binding protein 2